MSDASSSADTRELALHTNGPAWSEAARRRSAGGLRGATRAQWTSWIGTLLVEQTLAAMMRADSDHVSSVAGCLEVCADRVSHNGDYVAVCYHAAVRICDTLPVLRHGCTALSAVTDRHRSKNVTTG